MAEENITVKIRFVQCTECKYPPADRHGRCVGIPALVMLPNGRPGYSVHRSDCPALPTEEKK